MVVVVVVGARWTQINEIWGKTIEIQAEPGDVGHTQLGSGAEVEVGRNESPPGAGAGEVWGGNGYGWVGTCQTWCAGSRSGVNC